MIVERVDDPQDARLADYLRLTDPALRREQEAAAGLFIGEGRLVVERLLRSPYPVRSVLVTERGLAALRAALEPTDVTVYLVHPAVARATTGYDVHRGVLAAAGRLALPAVEDVLAGARTLLVLEDLTDQANLGAIFRNAAALGADGVLLSPRCCDPLYRRSVRVSMGAVLTVPFTYLDPWPESLEDLARRGVVLAALTPEASAQAVDDWTDRIRRDAATRVGLVLGAEGPGISEGAARHCTDRIRIPMGDGVDSLNVATAAAVALHCLRSARISRSSGDP